jgi:glutamate synthase (NADPH) small chain
MAKNLSHERRASMPYRGGKERAQSFDEVALGYSPDAAIEEANRCLLCDDTPCAAGCPIGVDVSTFIRQVADADFEGAFRTLVDGSVLPAVCGRVCPRERLCEGACKLGVDHEPVAIGCLERFVADYAARMDWSRRPVCSPPSGHRVAIVGAGPAGLTAAVELSKRGHEVTIFEAQPEPGGVLVHSIPGFRLPRDVVQREIASLEEMGVEIRTNHVVGMTLTVDDLFCRLGFEAVFLAAGAGMPRFPKIPGINLIGVYSDLDYLKRVNVAQPADASVVRAKRVAVVGGGSAAIDAVRTALRLGAEEAFLVYRRSRAQMPAREEEVALAEEEGARMVFQSAPAAVLGDQRLQVRALHCVRTQLGEPDESGRPAPTDIPGSEFDLEVDAVVFAIGRSANPLIRSTTPDLPADVMGNIVADVETGATQKPGVFAGGDMIAGGHPIISALGAGRRAALAIDTYLRHPSPDGC